MYLIVIAVLSIVLAVQRPADAWIVLRAPAAVGGALAFATLLPFALAAWINRRAMHLLETHTDDPGVAQIFFGRAMALTQGLIGVLHAGVLLGTTWLAYCRQTPVIGDWLVLPSVLAASPFVLTIVLVWLAVYPIDRAIRQIAVEVYLFRGRPVRPVWPIGRYLAYNLRHQVLFVLVPLLMLLAARDVIDYYEVTLRRVMPYAYLPDLLLGAAAVFVAVVAPELLRHIWVTQSLPEGPLRDKLQRLCTKLRMRCRDILVWRSGGMIVNAAVMGVVAPLRYVLITDAMLEQMDDTKIEAVFGHEAGHVKRHHILFFLLYGLISGCVVTIASIQSRHLDAFAAQALIAGVGLLLALKWFVLFGWVSRRFERQADVFGVRTLALAGVPCDAPCAMHQPATPAPRDALCATAAHLFGDTLNEVALLNGIPPEAPSWRHSSIASRSRFVQELAADPQAAARFERKLLLIKVVIFAIALAMTIWAAWEMRVWKVMESLWAAR